MDSQTGGLAWTLAAVGVTFAGCGSSSNGGGGGGVPINFNMYYSVAIGDVNGDGQPDLVLADDAGVRIRLQDPAAPGSFQEETKISE